MKAVVDQEGCISCASAPVRRCLRLMRMGLRKQMESLPIPILPPQNPQDQHARLQ